MARTTDLGWIGLGWALLLTFASGIADNASAQADRPPPAGKAAPVGVLERGGATLLDRVAFAVDGAESSHGADPGMWRAEPNGPQGPMQVSAAAAQDIGGGDRFDEKENRALGRAYLAHMYRRYGSWPDAVAAYNWGPGHMDAWISGGRPVDKLPLPVERYRIRVLLTSALPLPASADLFDNGIRRLGIVHRQPRRAAPDPHNGRAVVALLYVAIMHADDVGGH